MFLENKKKLDNLRPYKIRKVSKQDIINAILSFYRSPNHTAVGQYILGEKKVHEMEVDKGLLVSRKIIRRRN